MVIRCIEELYCQLDGKVYVSRDEKRPGWCGGCAFLSTGCRIKSSKMFPVACKQLKCIWKELLYE